MSVCGRILITKSLYFGSDTPLTSLPNVNIIYLVTLLGGNAYYVLSILYCFAAFSNFASSSVLSIFGKNTKVALTSASFCYVQYLAVISAYLYFKDMQDILRWVLYGSAALIGFGAAILWTAQGTVFNTIFEFPSRQSQAHYWL